MRDAEPPHGELGVTLPGSDRVRWQQMLWGGEEIRFQMSRPFVWLDVKIGAHREGRPLVDEISP